MILYSHQMNHYRGHATPTEYQSADLNWVTSKSFAILAMINPLRGYSKQSHVMLKMTILKVCWDCKLK